MTEEYKEQQRSKQQLKKQLQQLSKQQQNNRRSNDKERTVEEGATAETEEKLLYRGRKYSARNYYPCAILASWMRLTASLRALTFITGAILGWVGPSRLRHSLLKLGEADSLEMRLHR